MCEKNPSKLLNEVFTLYKESLFASSSFIELLIQIFGDVLVEIFVHFFAWIISVVVTDFDNDPKKRKILKTVIYIICLIACIVLLVLSFITYDLFLSFIMFAFPIFE